jgi:GTPase SAR1 family protein
MGNRLCCHPFSVLFTSSKDTAGQERFSSLSTAFFRGADAAILMFDVNDPSTMVATNKWWADFCDKAPVADDDIAEYCCVLVGNKIDMVADGEDGVCRRVRH